MPRYARKKCDSGIYHVIVRGINRQNIFHDEEDYQRFLETIDRVKSPGSFELYGYCLMGNHVHLLLHEQKDDLTKIMKRIGISYAWWYNWKYDRVGHVFQDRYKSETVEDETYIINLLRYIHNNPVKAEMVKEPEEYRWSSCRAYYGLKEYPNGLTSSAFILGILSENKENGKKKFKEFMKQENQDQFLDIVTTQRKSDECLYREIQKKLHGQQITMLQTMEKEKRDEILRQLKEIEGVSHRQIARVTGISPNIIFKV
jgi:putative transposase